MNNILDELEVPQPPYRMARPVACLAAVETSSPIAGADTAPMLEQIKPAEKPEISDEERARQLAEQRLAEQDKEWETFVSPEQVDAKVDQAAVATEQRIDATPADKQLKDEAKENVEKARDEYHQSSREGRTPDQAMEEFKGEGKKLGSVEDESESAEAALRRAEKSGNQKEIERLTKLTQSYSDAIEKKNTSEPLPTPEQTAEGRYEAALKKVNTFRVDGKLSEATLKDKAFLEAERELIAARKALNPEQPKTEATPPAAEPTPEPAWKHGPIGPKQPIDFDDAAREGQSVPGAGRDKRIADLTQENEALKQQVEMLRRPNFRTADSFDALDKMLRTAKTVHGSQKTFSANELLGAITDIRDIAHKIGAHTPAIEHALNDLPRTNGLRERVKELLYKEAVATEPSELPPVGGGGEKPPTPPEQPQSSPEQPERPEGGSARDALREIEMMGDARAPDFWDRQAANIEASMHDVAGWWSGIWAKRAKDKLAERDVKIQEAESKAKILAERSWLGTAFSPIVYGPRIAWHRWRRGIVATAQERHDDRKTQHENARNEVFNLLASRLDGPIITNEQRMKRLAELRKELDATLNDINEKLIRIQTEIGTSIDAQRKMELMKQRNALQAQYGAASTLLEQYDSVWGRENAKAARIQTMKNDMLRGATPATRSNTTPAARERLQQRVKRSERTP